MDDDDLALLVAWRAGDRGAGEALLARHFDTVCRFFHNKVGDDAMARYGPPRHHPKPQGPGDIAPGTSNQ